MCGIFGVYNNSQAAQTLLKGLSVLEYRGYDSAGIAVENNGKLETLRAEGKLESLSALVAQSNLSGLHGIGHTRWATHGKPNEINAHPHVCGNVAVVHNGIIENHQSLKEQLIVQGHSFKSETDSEVVPHLINHFIQRGYVISDAIAATLELIKGSYALGILHRGAKNRIYAVSKGSPLAIGQSDSGLYMASDALALSEFCDEVFYPKTNELVELSEVGPRLVSSDGKPLNIRFEPLDIDNQSVSKQGYEHYMLKEIHEQPLSVERALQANKEREKLLDVDWHSIMRLRIIACGTSYYSASVAKYWFESLAGLPVEIDLASEYRYREAPHFPGEHCMFISQSGETADTLAAMEHAQDKGMTCIAMVNVKSSSMARLADKTVLTHAGPEIGVASTKAFTSQLVQLFNLVLEAAEARDVTGSKSLSRLKQSVTELSSQMQQVIHQCQELPEAVEAFMGAYSSLFIARHALFPIALEGALKLKEISYIHAEGFASGELKHGPIALISEGLPVVALVNDDALTAKSLSNVREVMARGAKVILVAPQSVQNQCQDENIIPVVMPECAEALTPLLYVLPLQLLSYQVALKLERDVDQPRNLAKSVTVE